MKEAIITAGQIIIMGAALKRAIILFIVIYSQKNIKTIP
jgi:hypothetical protein